MARTQYPLAPRSQASYFKVIYDHTRFHEHEPMKLIDAINNYFDSCFEDRDLIDKITGEPTTIRVRVKPYTVTGLAMALGLTTEGLRNYTKEELHPNLFRIVQQAKQVIEEYVESQLFGTNQVTGPIFHLKNNFGWKDKTESEITGKDGLPIEFGINVAINDQRAKQAREMLLMELNNDDVYQIGQN